MQLELSLYNLLQLIGIGANFFIIVLLIIIDKGVRTKSFFLKLFFFCFFIIQFVVLLKQNHLFFLSKPYQHYEKLLALFLITFSLITLFTSLYFYIKHLMNKLNQSISTKVVLGTAIVSSIFTIEGAYEIFHLSRPLMIALLGIGVVVLAIYYSFKTFLAVKEYDRMLEKNFSYTEGISLKWVNYMSIYYILFFIGFVIDSISSMKGFTAIYMLVFVVTLGFAFVRNFIHYQAVDSHLHADDIEDQSTEEVKVVEENIAPQEQDSKEQQLYAKILETITSKELYLNDSLTLDEFAREVGTNYKYVRNAISEGSGKSFLEFINEYRTTKAKELILDKDNQFLPIDEIGELSGFKSKATFYKYFKIHFGQTPSAYRESQINS